MDRSPISISAYCRSGQTFVRHFLELAYSIDLPSTNHSVLYLKQAIDAKRIILVPFRNPLDSVASWNNFQAVRGMNSPLTIESDIAFWKRYYSYVLENVDKITLLDFDKFTRDIDYIITKVGQPPITTVTIDDVKAHMQKRAKDKSHLPNPDREESLASIKAQLKSMPEFQELLPIYEELKSLAA